jgi:hypothetical protein
LIDKSSKGADVPLMPSTTTIIPLSQGEEKNEKIVFRVVGSDCGNYVVVCLR